MKQRKLFARGLVGSLGILLMIACGGSAPDATGTPEGTPKTGTSEVFPPADAGSVEGQVSYAGPDPDVAIPLTADPTCGKLRATSLETEKIVGDGAGHLGNVFVYVKSGLPPRTYPAPPDKVELDQSGCAYLPRVVGVRVGQPLVLKNSDSTVHNVFAQAGANPQFNQGLPYAGMSFEKVFETPQVMMTLKCNVHPWMTAYVGVLDHPYFAVTGPDGKFTIPNLPPGTYTLEAWHETLGTKEAVVTVEKGGVGRVEVDLGAGG